MTVALEEPRTRQPFCRYCGLPAGGASHSSERECVEALAAEIEKARFVITRAHDPALLPGPRDREPAAARDSKRE